MCTCLRLAILPLSLGLRQWQQFGGGYSTVARDSRCGTGRRAFSSGSSGCSSSVLSLAPRINRLQLARTWRRLRIQDDSSTSEGIGFTSGAPARGRLRSFSKPAWEARAPIGASSSLRSPDSRGSARTIAQEWVTAIRARRRGRPDASRASSLHCSTAAALADQWSLSRPPAVVSPHASSRLNTFSARRVSCSWMHHTKTRRMTFLGLPHLYPFFLPSGHFDWQAWHSAPGQTRWRRRSVNSRARRASVPPDSKRRRTKSSIFGRVPQKSGEHDVS